MKFFLDTADLDDIKKYAAWGVVDGVTTNPSLMAKEGVDQETRIKEILEVVDGPISSEVISTDVEGMLEEGRRFAKWHDNIFVKLPTTPAGLQACKVLRSEGIKVNMTLIFSVSQAVMCAKAGANFISPFIGRVDDMSQDGMDLIAELTAVWANYDFDTEILVASIRHPRHVVDSMLLGAHIATMPPKIFDQLMKHPLTDIGLAKFLEDAKKSK
jgi:transaldolase